MVENFSNFMKNINLWICRAQQIPKAQVRKTQRSMPRYITDKLPRAKNKQKVKALREI